MLMGKTKKDFTMANVQTGSALNRPLRKQAYAITDEHTGSTAKKMALPDNHNMPVILQALVNNRKKLPFVPTHMWSVYQGGLHNPPEVFVLTTSNQTEFAIVVYNHQHETAYKVG
jgi:hypothetical protein